MSYWQRYTISHFRSRKTLGVNHRDIKTSHLNPQLKSIKAFRHLSWHFLADKSLKYTNDVQLILQFTDDYWSHPILWWDPARAGCWIYSHHHACHVHALPKHQWLDDQDRLSKDDWLLAALLPHGPIYDIHDPDFLDSEPKTGFRGGSTIRWT